MGRLRGFYASMVGKKVVMGVTGLIGIGFVILHSLGNLLVFRGPAAINSYSHFLKSTGELLWTLRIVLIIAVILHVIAAVQLTLQSRAARPVGYTRHESQVATIASRTMRWGGAFLLVFIVLHILHFTTGTIKPAGVFTSQDVYANVALGLHLFHGAWSSVRSIGVSPPSPEPLHRKISVVVAILVWAAFTAVPVAVLVGIVR